MNPFIKKIPFSRPSITGKEIRAVNKVLKSGWLTSGGENILFEEEFSQMLDIPYALSVNSATSGLHLSLECLGLSPGDRVLVPAYTFTATAEILLYCDLIPVIVDVDEDYNISPKAVKKALNQEGESIKAMIVVHLAGQSCHMEDLLSLAEEYNLFLIEDCAHAFPVQTPLGMLGTLGDLGVFSFYANKTITTGEGGMVVCKNKNYYNRMKLMRLHGIDRDIWNRFSSHAAAQSWKYDVIEAGFKYNLTNFQAALGRIQLSRAFALKNRRKKIVKRYKEGLSGSTLWNLPDEKNPHCWHLFMLEMNSEEERNSLIEFLYQHKIGSSVHYIPLPALSFYKNKYKLKTEDFPVSLKKSSRSLSLPLFPDMKTTQVKRVIKTIKKWEAAFGR